MAQVRGDGGLEMVRSGQTLDILKVESTEFCHSCEQERGQDGSSNWRLRLELPLTELWDSKTADGGDGSPQPTSGYVQCEMSFRCGEGLLS